MSSAIGLLSPMLTLRNTRSEPSIEACWRHLGRWWDANFKCSKRTWRSAIINKSCQLNEPSWRFCESRWNPVIGMFLFFFFFISFYFFGLFFLSSASWLGLWSKITSTYFFPFVHRNMGLKQIVHWGPLESAWILHHFQQKGIDISDLVTNVVRLDCETTQELRMKERNTTLDSFWKLLTNCVLIYEGAVVAILLHEFVPFNKSSSISPQWPTCGSLVDASPILVPPKPGWPCLDTNSTITIMSLPGELLNLGRTIIIFLVFSLEWTFWFSIFLRVLPQLAEQGIPFRAHGERLKGLRQCLGRQVCRHQLTPPLGVLASTTGRCLSQKAP